MSIAWDRLSFAAHLLLAWCAALCACRLVQTCGDFTYSHVASRAALYLVRVGSACLRNGMFVRCSRRAFRVLVSVSCCVFLLEMFCCNALSFVFLPSLLHAVADCLRTQLFLTLCSVCFAAVSPAGRRKEQRYSRSWLLVHLLPSIS